MWGAVHNTTTALYGRWRNPELTEGKLSLIGHLGKMQLAHRGNIQAALETLARKASSSSSGLSYRDVGRIAAQHRMPAMPECAWPRQRLSWSASLSPEWRLAGQHRAGIHCSIVTSRVRDAHQKADHAADTSADDIAFRCWSRDAGDCPGAGHLAQHGARVSRPDRCGWDHMATAGRVTDEELERQLFANGGVRAGARHYAEPDWG
jgi:hypothetical protein